MAKIDVQILFSAKAMLGFTIQKSEDNPHVS